MSEIRRLQRVLMRISEDKIESEDAINKFASSINAEPEDADDGGYKLYPLDDETVAVLDKKPLTKQLLGSGDIKELIGFLGIRFSGLPIKLLPYNNAPHLTLEDISGLDRVDLGKALAKSVWNPDEAFDDPTLTISKCGVDSVQELRGISAITRRIPSLKIKVQY